MNTIGYIVEGNPGREGGSEAAGAAPAADPAVWVDRHGDYLYGYALSRLRDPSLAEDMVQETLLAALEARRSYAGRSAERTWLTGILKHKIIDHYRRASRQATLSSPADEEALEHEELFRPDGEWVGHWAPDRAPVEWGADPASLLDRREFQEALARCLAALPTRIGSAFSLREIEGLTGEEICDVLSVSTSNLWVMLHRARMQLRRCLELNWFVRTSQG